MNHSRLNGDLAFCGQHVVVLGQWDGVRLAVLRKTQNSSLIRKFVRRMKRGKRKIVYGQIFEKAANLRPLPEGSSRTARRRAL